MRLRANPVSATVFAFCLRSREDDTMLHLIPNLTFPDPAEASGWCRGVRISQRRRRLDLNGAWARAFTPFHDHRCVTCG